MINFEYDELHYETLKARQNKAIKNNNTIKESTVIPIWSRIMDQWEDGKQYLRAISKEHQMRHYR